MARFIIRVELEAAGPLHYGRLHSAMSLHGFSTTIAASGGGVFQLPCGEYVTEGKKNVHQVLIEAKSAATAVSNSFSVVVSEMNNCTWEGLREVQYATA